MRFDAQDNRDEGAVLDADYVATVLQFPKRGPHAIANARQAATSTEEDRDSFRARRLEILALINQKQGEIFDLETEYQLLGGAER
jgi:hypothetical protein